MCSPVNTLRIVVDLGYTIKNRDKKMNSIQRLYEDTLNDTKKSIYKSRELNDVARLAWLNEVQRLLNSEFADANINSSHVSDQF